jgi:putative oxidoreductase
MLYRVKKFYSVLITIAEFFQSILLLAMRLYWGGSLVLTGWGKLHSISNVRDYFASLNIPFPLFNAYLVGTIECVCGLCLFLGLASRLVTLPIMGVLIGALVTEHRAALLNVWNNPQSFINQLPFNYLLTAFIVFAFGSGKISFDFLIQRLFYSSSKKNN